MSSAPVKRGRIRDFVRWVARTPWPVFALGMLQADIIGGLLVLGFLRFGLPPADRLKLQDLPTANLAFFIGYSVTAFAVGAVISLKLMAPVFRWQRRDALLVEDNPADTEQARLRALRMPDYRFVISIVIWLVGAVVFIAASWSVARGAVPILAVAILLGAIAAAIIGYLQAERVLRPVAVAALRSGLPENFRRPGVVLRLVLTWVLSTGVP
ncbi:MAG: adenylate/guanylate cyclase domain-containing protein, partial [Mycobacterium sp.]|nr:adenylate/guanylate cyclase domain-containing protein [Mycobacterium sp.]